MKKQNDNLEKNIYRFIFWCKNFPILLNYIIIYINNNYFFNKNITLIERHTF